VRDILNCSKTIKAVIPSTRFSTDHINCLGRLVQLKMTVTICFREEIQDTRFLKHDFELSSVERPKRINLPGDSPDAGRLTADYSLS
jgi:hypothetical protein